MHTFSLYITLLNDLAIASRLYANINIMKMPCPNTGTGQAMT